MTWPTAEAHKVVPGSDPAATSEDNDDCRLRAYHGLPPQRLLVLSRPCPRAIGPPSPWANSQLPLKLKTARPSSSRLLI